MNIFVLQFWNCSIFLAGAIVVRENVKMVNAKSCPQICFIDRERLYMTCPSSGDLHLPAPCNCCMASKGCIIYRGIGNPICTGTTWISFQHSNNGSQFILGLSSLKHAYKCIFVIYIINHNYLLCDSLSMLLLYILQFMYYCWLSNVMDVRTQFTCFTYLYTIFAQRNRYWLHLLLSEFSSKMT